MYLVLLLSAGQIKKEKKKTLQKTLGTLAAAEEISNSVDEDSKNWVKMSQEEDFR